MKKSNKHCALTCFCLLLVLLAAPLMAGTVVISKYGRLYRSSGGSWEKIAHASTLGLCQADADSIFFKAEAGSSILGRGIPAGITWIRFFPGSGRSVFLRQQAALNPCQRLADGRIAWVRHRFHGSWLYLGREKARPRRIDVRRGLGDPVFLPDGSYICYVIPRMGGKESPYFVDYVIGSTASLYHVKGGRRRRVLKEATTIQGLRLVNRGSHAVYWRPGKVDKGANRKHWELVAVRLDSGRTKLVQRVPAKLRGNRGLPYMYHTFMDSPWLLCNHSLLTLADRKRSFLVYNVVSGEKKRFRLGPGGSLFPPLGDKGGYRPNVVGKQGGQLTVWRLGGMEAVAQINLPTRLRAIQSACYLP